MRVWKFFALLPLMLGTTVSFGVQNVGGLLIDYQPAFQENVAKAQSWKSKMAPEMQAMLRQFQIFEAAGSAGIQEVRLMKLKYNSKIRGSIDEAASESVSNIVRLPGIKNPKQNIVPTRVSGREARRVSFESGRYDGKLGAEFLIVQDNAGQSFYQLQMIFSKGPGLNPLASLDLQEERTFARKTLDSVQLEKP